LYTGNNHLSTCSNKQVLFIFASSQTSSFMLLLVHCNIVYILKMGDLVVWMLNLCAKGLGLKTSQNQYFFTYFSFPSSLTKVKTLWIWGMPISPWFRTDIEVIEPFCWPPTYHR